MDTYLYLTVIPEALVGSMLSPEEFAPYLATGSKKSSHGRAIFFEIKREALGDGFDLSSLDTIQPHPDGKPKRSLTISIYRVLERVPMAALGRMFVVTRDGKYLAISPVPYAEHPQPTFHLYQELCPTRPTVVSKLAPKEFGSFLCNPSAPVYVPKILFADLLLGQMGDAKSSIAADMLPYSDIGNIRDAISILQNSGRITLMVDRTHSSDFFYRTVGEGFFVADSKQIIHYPFPTREELETTLHRWWRSAELS